MTVTFGNSLGLGDDTVEPEEEVDGTEEPTSTTTTEPKKEEDTDNKRTDSNWGQFLKSLLVFLIYTLIIGVVGCGFIYLTELNDTELDYVFPTQDDFYNASGIMTDYKVTPKCTDDVDNSKTNEIVTNVVGSVLEDNFPYSLIKKIPAGKTVEDMGLIDRLTNWFAITVKASFKFNRTLMKDWLRIFRDTGRSPLSNHAFQIYIGMPFTMLMSFSALFTGFGAAFIGAFKADTKATVWGMFLMFTWGMSFLMSLVIFLRLIVTLLFLPMSQNWGEIAKIMTCNVKVLVILFGFFATGAAYESLDAVIAGVMGIVFLMLVAYTVIQYFKRLFL